MTATSGTMHSILLEAGTNELEVMSFNLHWKDPVTDKISRVTFGINAAKVKELVAVPDKITHHADSHPSVLGVFVLRGNTIPLIDICAWFGYDRYISDTENAGQIDQVCLVTEINQKLFAFLVHSVDKVYRISWEQIQPPPRLIARFESIVALTIINGRILQLIDFERVIATIDPSMDLQKQADMLYAGQDEDGLDQTRGWILFADDSAIIRKQVSLTLTKARCRSRAFKDGQELWDELLRRKAEGTVDEVDAVATDIEMPRMDGHRLCKLIKDDPVLREIPVILFSSLINPMLRRKGEAVGADDQITKPELGKLVAMVERCIEKRGGRGGDAG